MHVDEGRDLKGCDIYTAHRVIKRRKVDNRQGGNSLRTITLDS